MDSLLFAAPLRLFLTVVLVIIEKDDVAVFRRVIHILKIVHKKVNTRLGRCLTPCFTRIIIELKRRLVLDKLRRNEIAGDAYMYALIDKYFPHSKSDRCIQHKERTSNPDRVHFLKVRQYLLDLVHDKGYSHHVVPDAKKRDLVNEVKRYVRAVNEEFPLTKVGQKRDEEAGNAPRKSKSSPFTNHGSPSTVLHLKDCSVVLKNCNIRHLKDCSVDLKNCNISCDEVQNEDTTHGQKRRITTCMPDVAPTLSNHLKDCLVQKKSKPMNTPTLSSAGLVTKVTRIPKSFDAHGRSNSKQRADCMKYRRRLVISSHKGFPLISRSKSASQEEEKQATGMSTTPDMDVAGPSSKPDFSVAGPLSTHYSNDAGLSATPDIDVAGPSSSSTYNFSVGGCPSSTPDFSVAGPLSTSDLDVASSSSTPNSDVADPSSTPDISFAGSSSAPNLDIAGPSSTQDISFAGSSSTPNIDVACPSTTADISFAGPSSTPDMDVAGPLSTSDMDVAGPSSTHDLDFAGPSSMPNYSVAGPLSTSDVAIACPSSTPDIVDLSTSPNSSDEMEDDGSIILIEDDDEEEEEEASFEEPIIELKERSLPLNSIPSTVHLRPCSVHLRKLNQLTVTHSRKLTIQNVGGPTIIKHKKYITRSIDVPGCGRIRLPDDLPECGLYRNVRVKL